MESWSQKLLDLSKSNRLLNVRLTSKIIPLCAPEAPALEDALAQVRTLPVLPADAPADGDACALRTSLSKADAEKRLKEIYRAGRVALEETGVNTIFATAGTVVWHEGSARDKPCRAPVILVPVQIERKSVREGYRVKRIDDDACVNPTLLELLRRDFRISIDGIDPLPADEHGVDVAAVFALFRKAISGVDGLALEEDCMLGQFSFGKFAMWKDLTERMDAVAANPIVRHLIERDGTYDDGVAVFPQEDVARHVDYSRLCCPLGADSSQLAAILYSGAGKSFVLHGPPGTGKSQTITNMIAHNLLLGRRVLFVSEKKAALDVVYSRLSKLGLAPFCLELHSSKSGKAEVYAQFRAALEAAAPDDARKKADAAAIANAEELAVVERQLDSTVAALHRSTPSGFTPYTLLANRIASRRADGGDAFRISGAIEVGRADYEAAIRTIEALAPLRKGIGADAVRALSGVKEFAWTPSAERELADKAASIAGRLAAEIAAVDSPAPGASAVARSRAFVLRAWRAALRRFKDPRYELPAVRRILGELCAIADADALDSRQCLELARGIAKHAPGNLRKAFMYFGERRAMPPFAESAAAAIDADDSPDGRAMAESFDAAFQAALLDELFAREPSLGTFSGSGREALMRRFRELDDERAALSKKRLVAKLSANIAECVATPAQKRGAAAQDPAAQEKSALRRQLGLLMHECGKKMRHKPVRRILAETPDLAPRLKPCFLMSPLTVAQYLATDASFDLVVFDEASQIPVWDAIGVIARGRQLVVVGDPRQLPPTNFFQKSEDDSETAAEDLESVLDECLHAGFMSCRLSWHYRSRHQSLIAFSNRHYYDGALHVFPSAANSPRLGVSFVHVPDGVYDAAASRTNRREAEKVADIVVARLTSPQCAGKSLGVVTFSDAQRNLIEDVIDSRRAADPALDAAFAALAHEPFFVKNLENVQGDERDAIVFSVGYAPDANGKFNMFFGPLARQGGERRLNVAITRAKESIVVVSSIIPTQIDTNRTSSTGVAHLRDFLHFAMTRNSADSSLCANQESCPGDPFKDAVARELEEKGGNVVVSRELYPVDIALRDPSESDRFSLGVICDGNAYAAHLTTRDRDRLNDEVLASLGWKLRHAWILDSAFNN